LNWITSALRDQKRTTVEVSRLYNFVVIYFGTVGSEEEAVDTITMKISDSSKHICTAIVTSHIKVKVNILEQARNA